MQGHGELKEGCNHMTWYDLHMPNPTFPCPYPRPRPRLVLLSSTIASGLPLPSFLFFKPYADSPASRCSRCGAEFCMICGAKWKTCECPWFNFDAVESDPLEHMPMPLYVRTGRFDMGPPPPPDLRARGLGRMPAGRLRPQTYEEELLLRRLQEQDDENMARRLQFGSMEEEEDNNFPGDVLGIGNQAGHFMNDDYRQRRRPEHMLAPLSPLPPLPPPPPAPTAPPAPSSFDKTNSSADYVSGVNRARGVRASSMERRLADRFNTDHRTSPVHRQTAPPPPPGALQMPGMPGMPPPPLQACPPWARCPCPAPGLRPARREIS